MSDPGPDNPVYATHAEAMTEILKAILIALEQNRDLKIRPALGETAEAAMPRRAAFPISGLAMSFLQASAEGLKSFIDTSGILQLVPSSEAGMIASYDLSYSNLQKALAMAGEDLEAAVVDPDGRRALIDADAALTELRDLFERRLASSLGLSPGFNALDGD